MLSPVGAGKVGAAQGQAGSVSAGHGHGQAKEAGAFGDLLKKLLEGQGVSALDHAHGATPPASQGQSTAAPGGVASAVNVRA